MMSSTTGSQILKWSEVDKVKFYGLGTGMYSALTVVLHPMTVLKIRQQVLNSSTARDNLQHQQTLKRTFQDVLVSSGVRGLFRGVGVVVSLAIPARVVYITVLEGCRHELTVAFSGLARRFYTDDNVEATMPLVVALSGGLAGGVAAMSAQVLVVPMDVISQQQMVMPPERYAKEGSALSLSQAELKSGGWRALYRGFGLSLLSSLPTGSFWWATYSGCQHWIDNHLIRRHEENWWLRLGQWGASQLFSSLGAALVASTLTQPIDVVRSRLQLRVSGSSVGGPNSSPLSPKLVAMELARSSGIRGFFRGLGPRTIHMCVWGSILSSAYELLRHASRKEQ